MQKSCITTANKLRAKFLKKPLPLAFPVFFLKLSSFWGLKNRLGGAGILKSFQYPEGTIIVFDRGCVD